MFHLQRSKCKVIDEELNAYAYFKQILKNISIYSVPPKVSNINEVVTILQNLELLNEDCSSDNDIEQIQSNVDVIIECLSQLGRETIRLKT